MKKLLIIFLPFLLLSCSGSRQGNDLEKEKNAILQADKDYSEALVQKDIQKIAGFIDDEATFIGESTVYNGKDATVKMWAANFTNPTYSVNRHPQKAYVSSSGDIGFTTGPYESVIDSLPVKGTYVYIWRKQADGSWKALVLKP